MLTLGSGSLIDHLLDHPWQGWQVEVFGMNVTLMSSAISTMILVAIVLVALIIPAARRGSGLPRGGRNVLEILTIFVRDRIAVPALHDKAYQFLPLLMTMFVFVLGMNLSGLLHLDAIFGMVGNYVPWFKSHPIGMAPTVVLTICAGLASISFMTILLMGLGASAKVANKKYHWPKWLCYLLSPGLWFFSLAPSIPGMMGRILALPLAALELIGAVAKCFSLMVRLFANMLAGHALLAALTMFLLMSLKSMIEEGTGHLVYIGPICVLGSVAVSLIELLVAGLQAYIFTFLTAIFLGLYVEPAH